ncbi:MAG: glycosyltransferase [Verrucomicrobiota bacterium]
MKVVVFSPLLSFPGHFARITSIKALFFSAVGMDVTVAGFPAVDKAGIAPELTYVSRLAGMPPKWQSVCRHGRNRLGKLWVVVIENILGHLGALQYARKIKADIVYITDLEPWVIILLKAVGCLRKVPPLVGFIPSVFFVPTSLKGIPFHVWARALLIHWSMPLLPHCMDVVCDNQFVADILFKKKQAKIHIIPDGFDREVVSRNVKQDARRRLNLPLDQRILLLFGVDIFSRGADLLYEALTGVEPAFMLCVVGKIARFYVPKHLGDNNGWDPYTRKVPGFVSEEERRLYFMACDAVILPYRQGYPMTSGCMRDAISFGKAVLVCDQYFVGDMVKKHDLGLTFPPEDIPAIRNCLRTFAVQPQEWFDQIEINCRGIVDEYCWERIAEQYRDVFKSLAIEA